MNNTEKKIQPYNSDFQSCRTLYKVKYELSQILSQFGVNIDSYGPLANQNNEWVLLRKGMVAQLLFILRIGEENKQYKFPVRLNSDVHNDFISNAARVLEIMMTIQKQARYLLTIKEKLEDKDLIFLFGFFIEWGKLNTKNIKRAAHEVFPQLVLISQEGPKVSSMVKCTNANNHSISAI